MTGEAVLISRWKNIEFDKRRKAYEAQQADKQDEEEIKTEMKMLEEAEKQVKFASK